MGKSVSMIASNTCSWVKTWNLISRCSQSTLMFNVLLMLRCFSAQYSCKKWLYVTTAFMKAQIIPCHSNSTFVLSMVIFDVNVNWSSWSVPDTWWLLLMCRCTGVPNNVDSECICHVMHYMQNVCEIYGKLYTVIYQILLTNWALDIPCLWRFLQFSRMNSL